MVVNVLSWTSVPKGLFLFVSEYSDTVECEQGQMRVPAWGREAEEFEGCPVFVGA